MEFPRFLSFFIPTKYPFAQGMNEEAKRKGVQKMEEGRGKREREAGIDSILRSSL